MTGRNMLGEPAGWYQDPAPANPANPETVRFWDGTGWTAQVRLASRKERQEWRERAAAQRREYARELVQRAQAGDVEAQQILAGATAASSGGTRNLTPDGARVSGWWRRAFAYLVDWIILTVLSTILTWRWLQELFDVFSQFATAVQNAAQSGRQQPDFAPYLSDMFGPLLMIAAVGFLLQMAYEVGFIRGFQATPGKMVLGLEVRLRSEPGPPPLGATFVRWGGKYGVNLFSAIPLVGLLVWFYLLIDRLWPLWDDKRQALHDKMAGTNVVRRR